MKFRKYTPEERQFFIDFVPGHSYKEILEEFNRRFSPPIKIGQVKGYIANHKLNTGRTGRFKPGHVPQNKGKKMLPEVYEKLKPTMFKEGIMPANRRPIGAEKLRDDGYWWVKIKDGCLNANWMLKHRKIWEEANGPIPEGAIIIFADGDRDNFSLDNLKLIDRRQHVRLNQLGLSGIGKNIDAAVAVVDLKTAIGKAQQRKKKEKGR